MTSKPAPDPAPQIRTGIGGWTYAPWRGTFYPKGLRHADELAYASAHVSAIEINATYYRLQKPESFAAWRAAVPEGFRFSLKASRFCTNRKVLADAGEAVARFMAQGLEELGAALGPVVWQFAPTKRFEADDFARFLDLLPDSVGGLALRHALEVRHESFACPAFVELARSRSMAVVVADHEEYPQIADLTAGFAYARLMRSQEDCATGYYAAALDEWARRARSWRDGHAPQGLAYAGPPQPASDPREVYVYFIAGAKERNPAAAMALAQRIGNREKAA